MQILIYCIPETKTVNIMAFRNPVDSDGCYFPLDKTLTSCVLLLERGYGLRLLLCGMPTLKINHLHICVYDNKK
jgi:hypothetical protein